jgi:hypothetical protein
VGEGIEGNTEQEVELLRRALLAERRGLFGQSLGAGAEASGKGLEGLVEQISDRDVEVEEAVRRLALLFGARRVGSGVVDGAAHGGEKSVQGTVRCIGHYVVLWTVIAESSDWTAVAEMAARQEQSAAVGDKEGEEEETRRETEKPARQVFFRRKNKIV